MSGVVRGRFLVIQVLVLALFCTLLARLWYLQVVGGDAYRAQAESNAVRQVVVQPQRGLIVDDMGRPIVTNRLSWVVTVDRSVLARTDSAAQETSLRSLAHLLDVRYGALLGRTKLCGEDGAAEPPNCWNGSPYEPVPVAQDVSDDLALTLQERREEFPGITAEQRRLRAYPTPDGVNAAHVLGYVSPVTSDEYDTAQQEGDGTVNAASLVGRAGLEREYDRYLRGVPGSTGKSVDSMGRVIGEKDAVAPTPGDTLVTSVDSEVQSLVESELEKAILAARKTHDDVTGRNYEASSGAAVVMDARNGRVVASASYPTYDPGVWSGGISSRQLKRLYSKAAGEPLLSRPTQGQLAPGSTFKPISAAGALSHGYSQDTRLNCSSDLQVGNRVFKNYESAAYGSIDFARALQLSCDTFFYRIGYAKWLAAGGDDAGVRAKDVLVRNAKAFGFGRTTGIDLPGESAGRIADRAWRRSYWESNKAYYCKLAKKPEKIKSAYLRLFAREFCVDGYEYRAGDAVNFVIGQGDTIVTPMQLAVAYGALSNGGTLWEPRVAKAVVDPDGRLVKRIKPKRAGKVPVSKSNLRYIDHALLGTAKTGTMAWKMQGFPLDKVKIRSKTGTAEVQGKQTTSWVATYDKRYVVIMMIEQGGTGSGTSGEAVRHVWEGLYGIKGAKVRESRALLPEAKPPRALPVFRPDGSIARPRAPKDSR